MIVQVQAARKNGVAGIKPPVPREHGAWGIPLLPLTTAVGAGGVFNLRVAPLMVSVLCYYIARTSSLKEGSHSPKGVRGKP
jgi:hypothetical protein